MQLNEYQRQAMRTHEATHPMRLAGYGLGLSGEAGEVADLLKKHLTHGHQLDLEKMALELGDVLWYVAGVAEMMGLTLDEIASKNIEKLLKRYPEGWDPERSQNREHEK